MALAQGNAAPGALQRARDTRQTVVLSTKARFNWLKANNGFKFFIKHFYDNITLSDAGEGAESSASELGGSRK